MTEDARRPFIRFEVVPIEDRAATAAAGVYMTQDVDFIIIVPHGSEGKTELRENYHDWIAKIKRQLGPVRAAGADNGTPMIVESRFPREWLETIEKGYAAWKKGEELPVEGTPLKQWAVLPPSMLQNCIANHIFTIEQLAEASDEAINPIGMGARRFRNDAQNWLKINKEDSRNQLVTEMSQMKADNAQLRQQVMDLTGQMAELLKKLPNTDPTTIMQRHVARAGA